MKLVYTAGPYRAASIWLVSRNIDHASQAARKLWKMGAAVICPHKNTAFFDGEDDSEIWLEGDKEMIRRCDALILLPGWSGSVGSKAEKELAESIGIPVFHWPNDVVKIKYWLQEEEDSW